MRRKNKFYLIWTLLFGLAVFAWALEFLHTYGFSDLNAFAEFLLPGVFVLGSFVIFVFSIRKWFFSSVSKSKENLPRIKGFGRTARCHNCKRALQEYTGSNCINCGWIRCKCGACGCSGGEMV